MAYLLSMRRLNHIQSITRPFVQMHRHSRNVLMQGQNYSLEYPSMANLYKISQNSAKSILKNRISQSFIFNDTHYNVINQCYMIPQKIRNPQPATFAILRFSKRCVMSGVVSIFPASIRRSTKANFPFSIYGYAIMNS